MQAGVPVDKFWDLSLQEITDAINAYGERERDREKRDVDRVFVLAQVIADRVAFAFSSEKSRNEEKLIMPHDVYPELYKEEAEKANRLREERELEAYKARRRVAAENWNRRFAEVESG